MSDPEDRHPLWLGDKPLVLASASRTRFALLAAAGIPAEVEPAEIDERAVSDPQEAKGVAADQIAKSLAHAKALAVSRKLLGRVVLAADQTLSCGGRLLHKPSSLAAAAEQLAFLSGKTHQLHAAVVIARSGKTMVSFVGQAKLTMRTLSPQMIDRYLEAAGRQRHDERRRLPARGVGPASLPQGDGRAFGHPRPADAGDFGSIAQPGIGGGVTSADAILNGPHPEVPASAGVSKDAGRWCVLRDAACGRSSA